MFVLTLEQVLILTIFIVAGYALAKTRIVDPAHSKALSVLTIYIFLPCVCFESFSKNCTPAYLSQNYIMLLVATGFLVLVHFLTPALSRLFARTPYEVAVVRYTLNIPNYGYTGYALCQGLLGDMALLDMMIYTLPLSVYTHSYGYNLLTKQTGGKLNLRKLLNPVMIGVMLGFIVGISGLPMPGVVSAAVNKAAACTAPMSMLLTGIAISEFDLRELFTEKRAWVISLLRLVGIPVVMFAVLKLLGLSSFLTTTMLVYAMPCGMNTIVYPKLIGEDCRLGASMALISTVLSLITIPFCLAFLT